MFLHILLIFNAKYDLPKLEVQKSMLLLLEVLVIIAEPVL
jgi:hypothetical protein